MKDSFNSFAFCVLAFIVGFFTGYGIMENLCHRDHLISNRQIVMETAVSETVAGKTECSIDGVNWFPSRDDNTCYLADAPAFRKYYGTNK